MHSRAASFGLTLAVLLGASQAAVAQTAQDAAMSALLTVCKPAAERQIPLQIVAQQAGYAKEAALPPGLPIVRKDAQSWRVPSSAGEVHLVSGAIPEPAQASACMVAVYGDPVIGLEEAIAKRVTAPDLQFELDPQQSFSTSQYRVAHYTGQRGYLSRNVMVVRPVTPSSVHPTLSIIAFRVDYSWLKSISR